MMEVGAVTQTNVVVALVVAVVTPVMMLVVAYKMIPSFFLQLIWYSSHLQPLTLLPQEHLPWLSCSCPKVDVSPEKTIPLTVSCTHDTQPAISAQHQPKSNRRE